jgi:hypothetical protein
VLPFRNDALQIQILSAGKVKQALAVLLDMIHVKAGGGEDLAADLKKELSYIRQQGKSRRS